MPIIVSSWGELERQLNDAYIGAVQSGRGSNSAISESIKRQKKSLDLVLLDLTRKMRSCISSVVSGFYEKPEKSETEWAYERTGNLQAGVDAVTIKYDKTAGAASVAYILDYDSDLLKSKSLWGDPAYDGNRFDLIQGGWQVQKNVWFKDFKNFGYRLPEDIIGQAIDKFRKEYDKRHLVSIYVYGARNVAPSDEAELYIDDGKAE